MQKRAYSRATDHVGEWLLTIWADSLEDLFAEAAKAIARQAGRIGEPTGNKVRIELEARDTATLLVDWLNELLARSEIVGEALVGFFELVVDPAGQGQAQSWRVKASVEGNRVANWHSPLKAATYHNLTVVKHRSRWKATVLFDV